MAGSVRTLRTEGPQWPCHSHTSKAGGWGTAACVIPPTAPWWARGDPSAEALAGQQGFGTAGAVVGIQWGCLMDLSCLHPEVGTTPCPLEVVREPDPDVPPVLISCVSIQLGRVSFPFHPLRACRASQAACPGSAHTLLSPSSSCADHREPQTTQSRDQGGETLAPAPSIRGEAPASISPHPGHGDGDAATPATP